MRRSQPRFRFEAAVAARGSCAAAVAARGAGSSSATAASLASNRNCCPATTKSSAPEVAVWSKIVVAAGLSEA